MPLIGRSENDIAIQTPCVWFWTRIEHLRPKWPTKLDGS